jgi:hypothetical protein
MCAARAGFAIDRAARVGRWSEDGEAGAGGGPAPEHCDGSISSSTTIRLRARHRGQCRGERVGMRGAITSWQRGHRTAGPRHLVIDAASFD